MNIINKGFLNLALLPKGIYQRLGVNTTHLRSILVTKLTIDDRRPNTIHQTQRKKREKPITGSTLGTILMSALLGLIYLVAFIFGNDVVTQLTIYFSIFFFMLSASLISDFTSVLIDVRDTNIILPKPVSDRTVVVARLLHIFIHICKVVVPMSLSAVVFIGYRYGPWGSVCLLVMVLLITVFVIFFINALYILILRFTSPQKFQSIISSVQIIFAITLYAAYQIVPRLAGTLGGVHINVQSNRFALLIPTFWFAGGWHLLYSFRGPVQEVVAACLSIILPVVSLFVVIKYLAPSFNNKLAMITGTNTEGEKKEGEIIKLKKDSLYLHSLSRFFSKRGVERMGFLFTWKMTARSRDFKLKVYPSIGYMLVYIVVIIFRQHLRLSDLNGHSQTGKIIMISALYIGSYLLIMALGQIASSEKFKASWIYYTTPVLKPGELLRGAVKAMIVKFYLPLIIVLTIAGVAFMGVSVLPNIILGGCNELLIACLVIYIGKKSLPFSMQESTAKKSGSFVRSLATLMVFGLIAMVHYFIFDIMAAVVLLAILSFTATWFMMDSIKNISWVQLQGNGADF